MSGLLLTLDTLSRRVSYLSTPAGERSVDDHASAAASAEPGICSLPSSPTSTRTELPVVSALARKPLTRRYANVGVLSTDVESIQNVGALDHAASAFARACALMLIEEMGYTARSSRWATSTGAVGIRHSKKR